MREKGYISKRIGHKRYFEVVSEALEMYILFFEELEGESFIIGDEIEFDVATSTSFGLCALNPVRISNLYRDELMDHLKYKTPLFAYVYKKSSRGFEASYHGYRCLCPQGETVMKGYLEEDEILHSYQMFYVLKISEWVILTKKELIQDEIQEQRKEEISQMYQGLKFRGKVKDVQSYGLFVTYRCTEGLLHASDFTDVFDTEMSNSEKKEFGTLLKSIFSIGRDIDVIVKTIDGDKYSLSLDKEERNNADIMHELALQGL
jgi:ribosomal protein S1